MATFGLPTVTCLNCNTKISKGSKYKSECIYHLAKKCECVWVGGVPLMYSVIKCERVSGRERESKMECMIKEEVRESLGSKAVRDGANG